MRTNIYIIQIEMMGTESLFKELMTKSVPYSEPQKKQHKDIIYFL
jgi:hypothetical protein